jgi:hypothetical protein
MLKIETQGSWHEMGRQIGEEFRDWFAPVTEHFASWLVADLDRFRPAIEEVRSLLLKYVPEIAEETGGMAEAVDADPDLMLGLRFFNELRERIAPGCSGHKDSRTDAPTRFAGRLGIARVAS